MNRISWFVAVAASVVAPVVAQDGAVARLENALRHLEWVTVHHGDRELKCFLVVSEVSGRATAVVVIPIHTDCCPSISRN
jgi:hypothetical protein